ncbi:competence protein ComK [Lysinibacillus endophyticus]|uniref:competence protein ComK n=1 Tax=Ureibacillus endophyticus TaxID=1978490 RepID=UPI00344E7455
MLNETLCLVPHYEGKISSIIYTKDESFKFEEKVETIINSYCLQYASNLQGRIQASRERFSFIKNPPINVNVNMYIFAHLRMYKITRLLVRDVVLDDMNYL